jgi:hypothetical protein
MLNRAIGGGDIMKRSVALVVLSSAVLLSACSSLGRAARVDPASVVVRNAPAEEDRSKKQGAQNDDQCPAYVRPIKGDKRNAINLDCFKFEKGGNRTAYQLATSFEKAKAEWQSENGLKEESVKELSDDQRNEVKEAMRQARNRLGFILINQADTICEDEKGTLYSSRALSAGALDFLASGFAGASTIVGGEQAKSILSGLAGLSTATRTNIDANVYQNQLISAITKVMDAERADILTELRSRQPEEVAQFSADEMIVIANQYHQACSFQNGVQLLLDAALNKEGVDKIIKSINIRSTIAALETTRSTLQAQASPLDSPAMVLDRETRIFEINDLIQELTLQQFEIGRSSNDVVVTPNEGEPAVP